MMTDDKNRDPEPCPDGECKHIYDDWPAGSVTQRDREIDQCSLCEWTAPERAERTRSTIPVLWFDAKGRGPDELVLQLHPFPAEFDGRIPAYLGIRVCAGGLVIGAAPLVDGGFNLGREQVADLHRQLGAWLEKNP